MVSSELSWLAGRPARDTIRFVPLGGLGEVGKNLAVLEIGDDALLIDAGLRFPEEENTGADVILPDTGWLFTRGERLRAVVLTHGHEDHIGALPFLIDRLSVPIYGTAITLGLLRNKLLRRGTRDAADLRTCREGDRFPVGQMEVELIHTTHSVPGSCALAVRSSAGTVVHTGDFKLDQTPTDGPPPDLARMGQLGEEGVRLMLSDSTNAMVGGLTPSELSVRPALRRALMESPGRVIVVTFASNLARIRQTMELAAASGRRCCVVGRSMLRNVGTAAELAYLDLAPTLVVQPRELHALADSQICLLATGSQGEPLAALSRIASGVHPFIRIHPGDTVVLAANPVPGNEAVVARVVNRLLERGAEVLAGSRAGVHASGHGSAEELAYLLQLVRPQYFVPVHGERRHLAAHAELARLAGMERSRIAVLDNGSVLEVGPAGLTVGAAVSAGAVPVDAEGRIGRVGRVEEGILVLTVKLGNHGRALAEGPELSLAGYGKPAPPAEPWMDAAAKAVRRAVRHHLREVGESRGLREVMRRAMEQHLEAAGGWRPALVSVVLEDRPL